MSIHRWAAALVITFAAVGLACAEPPFRFEDTPGQLSKQIRPIAYRIEIVPDVKRLAVADGTQPVPFAGKMEADFEVLAPADRITVHAAGLDIQRAVLNGTEVQVTVDEATQTATIHLANAIAPGRHALAMTYSGSILTQPQGLYYVVYDTAAGPRRMLSTQMQPTDARRVFPGWDEPIFKAAFTLSVVVPVEFRAFSNMPIAREVPAGPGLKSVAFDPSPRMSSYLVVLTAGELDRVSEMVGNVDVGIVVPAGLVEQARYALDAATKALGYFVDYFGVKYPLPKLDHIAVPGRGNAMENWGAVTYDDSQLLFSARNSSQATRERIFRIVAHETAHQWVGNLVTMAWWDNLWLNEAFASWMEIKVADHFNRSWKLWPRAHASKNDVIALDALRTSHPIQQEVIDGADAMNSFDSITYDKGQHFVRMLESYLGEDAFRAGMRAYMAKHAYSSTTGADLWAALATASGKRVAEVVAGFTERPGVPLVQVATACIDGKAVTTLRQERFVINDPYADRRTWLVPVAIGRVGEGEARQTVLVGDQPQTVRFDGCDAPVLANVGDVGYFRVEYDTATLAAFAKSYDRLALVDRIALFSNAWAMVEAGRTAAANYLDLSRQLVSERELAVWFNVGETLKRIDRLAEGSSVRAAFRTYATSIVRPAFERIGWDARPGESSEAPILRALLITLLGRFGEQDVIAEVRRRFARFLLDGESLDKDLREPVAIVVGHWADRKTFEALHRLGREATSTEDKRRYYAALGGAFDSQFASDIVDIARTDQKLPSGQIVRFLHLSIRESGNPERLYRMVAAQAGPILRRLTESERIYALPDAASALFNPALAFDLKWKDRTPRSRAERYEIDKAAVQIEQNALLRERLLPALEEWLIARH